MGRFERLPPRLLFRLGLVSLCAALLVVLTLVSQAQPAAQASAPTSPLALAATPTPPAHATPTPRADPGKGQASQPSSSAVGALPAWLIEGLGVLLLALLGFSLIIFPIAVRSARTERAARPVYRPSARVPESEQVARLSQIPPERKEPLSREQMRALRAASRAGEEVPQQTTASLATIRLINGVPISAPDAEEEAAPPLPAPRWTDREQNIESESEG